MFVVNGNRPVVVSREQTNRAAEPVDAVLALPSTMAAAEVEALMTELEAIGARVCLVLTDRTPKLPERARNAEWMLLAIGAVPEREIALLRQSAMALVSKIAYLVLDPAALAGRPFSRSELLVECSLQPSGLQASHFMRVEDTRAEASRIARAMFPKHWRPSANLG